MDESVVVEVSEVVGDVLTDSVTLPTLVGDHVIDGDGVTGTV